jgi:hypothetical protein
MTKPNVHRIPQHFLFNEKGSLFLIAYMVIFVLLLAGAALVVVSFNDSFVAERQKRTTQAFYIAQAGINRALADLNTDYQNSTDWTDGDINGLAAGPNTASFYALPYASTTINNGSYAVTLRNVTGTTGHMWVRSTGSVGDATYTIQAYAKMISLSPWNNAIFAGSGAAGMAINGNVSIHGSVHILGNGLQATDMAMDLGGGSMVSNNYSGLASILSNKMPTLPTVTFGGETVSSLDAVLRVKKGLVGLTGSAVVGNANVTGNSDKETVDGIYSTNGFSTGTASAYSDNGYSNTYDMGDSISFPSLGAPYGAYATYQDYLRANALVISDATNLAKMANITPTSNFSISDANGSISFDGSGNMTISGIVYVDGGDINMNIQGSNKIINYTGTGSLFATGNVGIDVNLYTTGNGSFPTNILAVMTPQTIDFNAASIDVMGLFYGETQIKVQKQTTIVGSLVTNYFDLGTNVPSIYYVPDVINNLPSGLIGSTSGWQLQVVSWQDI